MRTPQNINKHGYISEYHAYGESAHKGRRKRRETCQKHLHHDETNEAGLKTFRIPRASFADEQGTGRP